MVNLCNFRTKFLTEMYLMILQRTFKFSRAYKDVIFLNCRFSNSLNCESVSRFFSVIIDLTHYWKLEFSKLSFRSTFGWTIPSENDEESQKNMSAEIPLTYVRTPRIGIILNCTVVRRYNEHILLFNARFGIWNSIWDHELCTHELKQILKSFQYFQKQYNN